jgi:hypothetical protein
MHGPSVAIKAACVQGAYSFFVTLGMTLMLEAMFTLFKRLTGAPLVSAFSAVIFSCTPVFVGSWMINAAAGTPEIFETVALGYVLGAVYCSSYTLGLLKENKT